MKRLSPEEKKMEIARLKKRDAEELERVNKLRESRGLPPLKPYRKHYSRLV